MKTITLLLFLVAGMVHSEEETCTMYDDDRCHSCNGVGPYILVGNVCHGCSSFLAGCTTKCRDRGYFFAGECKECSLAGSSDCTEQCKTDGYYFDSTASKCKVTAKCDDDRCHSCNGVGSYTLDGNVCQGCSFPGECTTKCRDHGFYFDSTEGECKECSLAGSSDCTKQCKSEGYYFDSTASKCRASTLYGDDRCHSCNGVGPYTLDGNICRGEGTMKCRDRGFYFDSTMNGVCEECSLAGPSDCTEQCKSDGYYFDSTASECKECAKDCLICNDNTSCENCRDHTHWDGHQCSFCWYADKSGCESELCRNNEYYFNATLNKCQVCRYADKSGCESKVCRDSGYYFNAALNKCQDCRYADKSGCESEVCIEYYSNNGTNECQDNNETLTDNEAEEILENTFA